jgi:hypothetical protein
VFVTAFAKRVFVQAEQQLIKISVAGGFVRGSGRQGAP